MLLAMTYSGELFLSVMLGLLVGHLLFNRKAKVTESVEACCCAEDGGENGLAEPLRRGKASALEAGEAMTLRLGGMTCGHCVDTISHQLEAQPGVKRATVSLPRQTAELVLEPGTDPRGLVEAVQQVGFSAYPA